jgi:hypothetical protein
LTDSAAGERCESRLLVLLFLGSETWCCSGKEVKRVSCGSDDGGSWWWGEPGGVTMSVDVKEEGRAGQVRREQHARRFAGAASAEQRRHRACMMEGEYSRHARGAWRTVGLSSSTRPGVAERGWTGVGRRVLLLTISSWQAHPLRWLAAAGYVSRLVAERSFTAPT